MAHGTAEMLAEMLALTKYKKYRKIQKKVDKLFCTMFKFCPVIKACRLYYIFLGKSAFFVSARAGIFYWRVYLTKVLRETKCRGGGQNGEG